MAVHLHRAHRSDRLADELARLLADPLPDPFATELVVVPARGVERWLTQRLAHTLGATPGRADGVCAGIRLMSPRSLVAMLTGAERSDPWDPDRLIWPLLATIDESMGQAWARPLARYLETEHAVEQRYALARRLAGLFSRYATQRPAMLRQWRDGQDADGHGAAVDADLRWQPELYRRLLQRIAAPPPDVRHAEVVRRIEAGAELALPARLSMFGHTRLAGTEVELLAAVGRSRDVHLWLPQASETLWRSLAPVVGHGPVARADDPSADAVGHPLLSSLGRDARELQRTLAPLAPATDTAVPTTAAARPPGSPGSLLGWLQHDLRANAEPTARERASRALSPDDATIAIHACHGPARQVDVVREVLVGLLQDDPSLQPRDILVMCPDIEAFAPLFEAGFGLADVLRAGHPAHGLRVRLADRNLGRTNPLLELASRMVTLAGGRAKASEVLDLAGTDVVRRRFSFSDDDLEQLTLWVEHTGIRWGLAPDLRAPYALDSVAHNTWQLGLDRLLVGVAMAEEGQQRFGQVLPLDDVPSASIDLAGRFAEFLDRLERTVRRLLAAGEVGAWMQILGEAAAELGAVPESDAWQRTQLDSELAAVADAASGTGVELRLADVRLLLEQRLGGRPTRANFRTGALTVSTLVPMRSVPHRVLCLVGLDDGVYPRTASIDDDDVLARSPRTGERDVRAEDRQLLLDAILAAQERLIVTYSGFDEIKGGDRTPAVPVGELIDAVVLTCAGSAADIRDRVIVRHPLQPFDARSFRRGVLSPAQPGEPFSFDLSSLRGALATVHERAPSPPFLTGTLPPVPRADVTLADLHAFLQHPVRAFVRRRLGVSLRWDADEPTDAIPVDLGPLEQWAIGDRLLRRVIDGAQLDEAEAAERSRGVIPPFALGGRVLSAIRGKVEPLLEVTEQARAAPPEQIDVTVDLDGIRLTGQVPDVRAETLLRVSYSRLGPKHRLASWVDLLALVAADAERGWRAETIGSGGGRYPPQRSLLGGVSGDRARATLGELIDLMRRGLAEPLPLPLKTAATWAQTPGEDWERSVAAGRDWYGGDRFPGEQADDYHRLVWGPDMPLRPDRAASPEQRRGLLAELARDGEYWNTQATRLGQYALRLWTPLLAHEQVGPA